MRLRTCRTSDSVPCVKRKKEKKEAIDSLVKLGMTSWGEGVRGRYDKLGGERSV